MNRRTLCAAALTLMVTGLGVTASASAAADGGISIAVTVPPAGGGGGGGGGSGGGGTGPGPRGATPTSVPAAGTVPSAGTAAGPTQSPSLPLPRQRPGTRALALTGLDIGLMLAGGIALIVAGAGLTSLLRRDRPAPATLTGQPDPRNPARNPAA
ncbi:hypothetical protein [Rugosimonospora africana]|uniref:Uncharacterized protein n=1 Tax=Rugosimonospora africana TaxID=556532 RepID=A0A8J3VVY0_9ACTN|nr:hypothetical protein [Rugosimonospora africana]GIH20379.1 hypothetical protein Raf01_85510 [Rugosimonospora africana]